MPFLNARRHVQQHIAARAQQALPTRVKNSKFAGTVLAPVLANHVPWLITPYLGLRARLSQVWINRWTILLILCLVRILLAIVSMHEGINSARREALSACTGVEAAGSAMASMPHYMSQGVNELTAHGVEKAVNGLMEMLTLSVTGVEEMVVFVINLLTSTYVCLITLVVGGSLHAAISLIEDVTGFLNQTLGDIGNDIQDTVNTFEKGLNGVVSGLNDIGNLFGGHNGIPKLDLDIQISALHNLKLPTNLTTDLNTLDKNIPSFAQVNNSTNNAIRYPFEEIRKLIGEHSGNYTFDRSIFPVPAKEKLTFCTDNGGINSFFDDLLTIVFEARKIATAVLLMLAVLVTIPMAYREQRRYRKMRERAALMDEGHEPMDVVYLASRPLTSDVGLKLAKASKVSRRQALIRWAIAYATTVPALFVLSLGVAGLFACLTRYIILQFVTKEVPHLVNEVEGFADEVLSSLNNASMAWANGTNHAILNVNNKINSDIFGWVNISTHALNNTLNVFVDESITVLNDTFGGTILYDPVTELFNCLIGLKVAGIEKGLTWISDNSHVDFPLLPNNTFSLGAAASLAADNTGNSSDAASSFLANPSGGTTDAISATVEYLISHIEASIRTEAIISACVVGVWVIIALIGMIRALTLFYGDDKDGDDTTTGIPNDPRSPTSGSNASTPTLVSSSNTRRQPTLPTVNGRILSEKQAIAEAISSEKPENPFADPTDAQALYPGPYPYPDRRARQRSNPLPAPTMRVQSPTAVAPVRTGRRPSPPTPGVDHVGGAVGQGQGNTYRGVPYTLSTRPMPQFRTTPSPPEDTVVSPLSPVSRSADALGRSPGPSGQEEARTGAVKSLGVGQAIKRPDYVRQSSHVRMEGKWDGEPNA